MAVWGLHKRRHGRILIAFCQQPKLGEYRNKLAPFVPSPEHAVDKMLEVASLKPGETLYDLGCGDGRILIAAAASTRSGR